MRRILLSPWWLARHALALCLIALFLRMGVWQLTKGESEHGSLQNLFYGVEWPIFAAFVIYWWWRMIAEDLRPKEPDAEGPQWGRAGRIAPEAPATGDREALGGARAALPRQPVPGASATEVVLAGTELAGAEFEKKAEFDEARSDEAESDEDRELAAYNRYLASLYERDAAADHDTKGARR